MALQPDTSFLPGLTLSICSTVIWQREGPRRNLRNYESVGTLLFAMAILVIVMGPFTIAVINYAVPLVIAIITIQQVFDQEIDDPIQVEQPTVIMDKKKNRLKVKEPTPNVSNDENNDQEQLQVQQNNDKEQPKEQTNDDTSNDKEQSQKQSKDESNDKEQPTQSNDQPEGNCDVCNESRMYSMFKNLRDKFSFSNDV